VEQLLLQFASLEENKPCPDRSNGLSVTCVPEGLKDTIDAGNIGGKLACPFPQQLNFANRLSPLAKEALDGDIISVVCHTALISSLDLSITITYGAFATQCRSFVSVVRCSTHRH
jgi:hypothetical protein